MISSIFLLYIFLNGIQGYDLFQFIRNLDIERDIEMSDTLKTLHLFEKYIECKV